MNTEGLSTKELMELHSALRSTMQVVSKRVKSTLYVTCLSIVVELENREDELKQVSIES